MRRPVPLLGALAAALVVPLLAGPAAAQTAPAPPPDSGGAVFNILPPGSRGNVTVPQAAMVGPSRTATGTNPPNFADQLEKYDALTTVEPSAITDADLPRFYKDAAIDLPDSDAVSTTTPKPGVTIKRDSYGVPFVTGVTAEDVAYGAGYVGAQDRMFLTDLLRHVGAARMAEFLGPTDANIAMDASQLRLAPYKEEEAQQQLDSVLTRYPDEGKALLARLDAFLAGINDAQHALCPLTVGVPVSVLVGGQLTAGLSFGPDCPVEYAVLEHPPTDFTRADIVYIASLVGGIFGKGGGGEASNALWYQQLTAKYGAGAKAIYEDLRERNDPEAPVTAHTPFPYMDEPVDPTAPGAALPDLGVTPTPSTGSGTADGSPLPVPLPLASAAAPASVVDGPFGKIDLGFATGHMSNALLVDAKHSASGHPTVVFGPQTGYYTPQLLMEVSLRGPGIAARGVSFAGTQLIVELGHGVDYAWSATSASSDLVDTVAEHLCDTAGGDATVTSDGYLDGDVCRKIDSYTHTEAAPPTAAGQGLPQIVDLKVERTRHGVVQERTTVGGVPVAVVLQRSTYGHELDSAVGFARVNDPGWTHDAASFMTAFAGVDYTFNWFYADAKDIAYYGSGLLPVRAAGANPDLPRWGDPQFDWTGFLPDSAHARDLNPPQGYLTSWNNKQAPEFSAADHNWGYGPVYRSQLLDRRIQAALAQGPITRPGLVGAMAGAAVADLRAEQLLPLLLDVVGDDPAQADAVALLRSFAANPYRVDRDRDGTYSHPAAIALFDEWWESAPVMDSQGNVTTPRGAEAAAKDVLRDGLGDLVDQLPQELDDHPRQGLGSSWNDVAWYGYVSKTLRSVLGQPVVGPYSQAYCGDLATCRTALQASLAAAVQRVLAQQGVSSVDALTYDKTQDDITPVTAGLVGARNIDWQNRPTFQQVVAFSTRRTAPVAAPPAAPAAPPAVKPVVRAAPGPRLAATGASAGAPAAGLALLLAAVGLRRRRARRT